MDSYQKPMLGFDLMMDPHSIAVVGASEDPNRIGGRPISYMLNQGFRGEIFPVNPNRRTVQGLPAYSSVDELPNVPDVAIVAVPAEAVPETIDRLGVIGVKGAIVFSSGFSEVDTAGRALQQKISDIAHARQIRILGPNTLGLYNARKSYYPIFSSSFEGGWPHAGRIAMVSQSGAFASHIFTSARNRGIGVPICICTGNEADITIAEAISWAARDEDTDVIGVYVEGIREPDGFIASLAKAMEARKPIVLMKVGRSPIGQRTVSSHTAAIAGDDVVFNAVLSEFGVVRVNSAEALLDIAYLATYKRYPVNNTLGVISISGGAAALISDVADDLGLALPEISQTVQAQLKKRMPYAAVANPVDCTAQALNDIEVVGDFMSTIVKQGGYACVLAFFAQLGSAPSIVSSLLRQLGAVRSENPDRLYVACIIGSKECISSYEAAGFAVFEDPNRATVAIHAMGQFGEAFSRSPSSSPVQSIGSLPEQPLNEAETKALLQRSAGIRIVPEAACADPEKAVAMAQALGYPVVLKVLSPDIRHKSDIGGVLLNVGNAEAVRNGYLALRKTLESLSPRPRFDGVLVSKQLDGGIECIMGVHRDPLFGLIAMFGLGGIFVEVLRDVVFHRCPFGVETAEAMIRNIRAAPILTGTRNRPPVDIKALAEMLARLSMFAYQAGHALDSVEINPVIAIPGAKECFAADALLLTR